MYSEILEYNSSFQKEGNAISRMNFEGVVRLCMFSRGQLFATPWAVDCLAPLSMGFSRQEYCSGLPFPHPGELPDPGAKPASPALEADFSTAEPSGKSR